MEATTELATRKARNGKADRSVDRRGNFAELGDGRCHYRLEGPRRGPPVLLLHGATVPCWQFDRLAPHLWRAGYRTLRADLFGHGLSDRPALTYDQTLFVRQLRELLDCVEIGAPLHVLAHSMGAAVAARLIGDRPEAFVSAVLHAPMLDFESRNRSLRLLRVPGLGELLMPSVVVPSLVREWTGEYALIEDGRWADLFRVQVELPGFGGALLSMIRNGALADQSDGYRALGETGLPALVIHGTADTLLDSDQIARILEYVPTAGVLELDGRDHGTLLTEPHLVASATIAFFDAQRRRRGAEAARAAGR